MTPMINEEGAVDLFDVIAGAGRRVRRAIARVEGAAGRAFHQVGHQVHRHRHAPD